MEDIITNRWDKLTSEFSEIGKLDKMLFDPSNQTYLPYNLRLIYALVPYFDPHHAAKTHGTTKVHDDKTIERLFNLISFCESKLTTPYPQADLGENETVSMKSICDIDISQQSIKSFYS